MIIVGISAFYHDAACCLMRDGQIVAAASEERFTRHKNDARLPVAAFRFCLAQAGLTITDIDRVAYYESPQKKLERQQASGRMPANLDASEPLRLIAEYLGYHGPIDCFDHHASHAASAFYLSGFEQAALFTVDGVGEWTTTSYGRADRQHFELFEEVRFPHSLGLFYATLTSYLGFKVNSGEYKVMGLAPYGQPKYVDQLRQLIENQADGQYRLDLRYFDFVKGTHMYAPALIELLGRQPRAAESEIQAFHTDVARSLQVVLEEILLEKVDYLHRQTGLDQLCMAGGVALNCVANGKILRQSKFSKLFVQPAAGDAGSALGAAALSWSRHMHARPIAPLEHVYLGPEYDAKAIATLLRDCGLPERNFAERESELLDRVVTALAADQVVGWFQGRAEFGPRALGARSILANPQSPTIRDRLNAMVKKRESFRPFAPCVLEEHAAAHFELDHPSPFMLETCQVRSRLALPGITHVDQSARPQTVSAKTSPRFAALLRAFHARTGCPILVNTSFNVRGEPIVNSPTDALRCAALAQLDLLVLGDYLIEKKDFPSHWRELLPHWETVRRSAYSTSAEGLNLYSFV